ncbi:MAG TPA: hypothetical protein VGS96_19450 [Thermoanaerobaculia bacterium]|jgi:hypothetical protein|nr:hypothetical protein [Thermoanaerobaculia bacterium]
MRRHTAALLLALSVFSSLAAYAPDPGRGGFLGRIRQVIQKIVRHIAPDGDWLSPPKP